PNACEDWGEIPIRHAPHRGPGAEYGDFELKAQRWRLAAVPAAMRIVACAAGIGLAFPALAQTNTNKDSAKSETAKPADANAAKPAEKKTADKKPAKTADTKSDKKSPKKSADSKSKSKDSKSKSAKSKDKNKAASKASKKQADKKVAKNETKSE